MSADTVSSQNATTERVLVLGHGTRAFLTVIRSLARCGLEVHVGMCAPTDLALKSRYITQYHEIKQDSWLDDMRRVLQEHSFSWVLPCGDESMHPVQVHQAELRQFTDVYAYEPELYRVAFNKYASTKLAHDLGIPVARQVDITPETSAKTLLSELDLPLVLKPASSIDEEDSNRRREVLRVRSETALATHLEDYREPGAVAQENFVGIGVGVEVLAKEGKVLVAFQHQRVHEPVEGGGSSYRRSAELRPDMLDATERLMQALNYTGVAMVEFKLNPTDDKWIFIEINGRFWGSLPLAVGAGVDFPAYLYRMRTGQPLAYPGSYRVGVHSRSMLDDYHWFANNLRADHSDPSQATVPLWKVFAELRNVVLLRERIDTLALDDMRPFWAEFRLLIARIFDKFSSLEPYLLPPFVLNKRAKTLRDACAKANNIGFICYGNICRSPFAHVYASAVTDKVVWSSGFHDKAERAVPEAGQRVAQTLGVDLANSRSTILDAEAVSEADVLLIFDEKNHAMITERFPEAGDKVFFLNDAVGARKREIEDPYGNDDPVFLQTYQQIVRCVDALLKS